MRASVLTALFAASIGIVFSAARHDAKLTIKGIGLGSSPSQVSKGLGKPARVIVPPPDDVMGMGQLQDFEYPGVTFEFCKPEGRTEFHVWRLIVTSRAWRVAPGLRIGMLRADVFRILGAPERVDNEGNGRESLQYDFTSFDGAYWVVIENGSVIEIGASEDWS